MKKYFFCLLAVCLPTFAFGALPPLYKDIRELRAILNDQRFEDYLNSGDSILELKKADQGWVVITNHGNLPIKVNYKRQEGPGPGNFTLEFMAQ